MSAYAAAKARAVRLADAAARASSTSTMPSARRWRRGCRLGGALIVTGRHVDPAQRAQGARFVHARSCVHRADGLVARARHQLGPGHAAQPPARRIQRRQSAHRARHAARGGMALEPACEVLAACEAPPGRMELSGGDRLPLAIVDYAHTPDALDKALRAARAHCAGKLLCVFGCGGERDRGKRAEMARVAERWPMRSSSPTTIRAAKTRGASSPPSRRLERPPARARIEHDRAAAIAAGTGRCQRRRCGAGRRQGPRGLSARGQRAARLQRPGAGACGAAPRGARHEAHAGAIRRGLRRQAARRRCAFAEVLIDSRTLTAGDLFLALPGERVDGHDFVAAARGPALPARSSAATGRAVAADRWWPTWPRRSRGPELPGARPTPAPCSASPAAMARPPPRKCWPRYWRSAASVSRRAAISTIISACH